MAAVFPSNPICGLYRRAGPIRRLSGSNRRCSPLPRRAGPPSDRHAARQRQPRDDARMHLFRVPANRTRPGGANSRRSTF